MYYFIKEDIYIFKEEYSKTSFSIINIKPPFLGFISRGLGTLHFVKNEEHIYSLIC